MLLCSAIWNLTTQQEVSKHDSCKLINLLCWQEGHSGFDKTDCSLRHKKTYVRGVSVHCVLANLRECETSHGRVAVPNEPPLAPADQPCRDSFDDKMDVLWRAGCSRYSTHGNSKSSTHLKIFIPAEKSQLPLILTIYVYFISLASKLVVHFFCQK